MTQLNVAISDFGFKTNLKATVNLGRLISVNEILIEYISCFKKHNRDEKGTHQKP
jgi:hypothetical protein